MASLAPEDQVRFLLACLKNTESAPDFAAVAVDCGLEKRYNARARYKSLIEAHNFVINGENRIEMKDDTAPPATPKTTGAKVKGDEATPAETPSTTSPKKRGRPKKGAEDGDQTETPAKKPRKPRQPKKEKQNDGEADSKDVVQAQVEKSNIGDGSNGNNVDNLGTRTNGNVDED